MVVIVFAWHMVGGMEGMGCEECGGDTGGRRGLEGEDVRTGRILKDKEFMIKNKLRLSCTELSSIWG